jgi:hypothetical protein
MRGAAWLRTLAAIAFSVTLTLVLAELLLRLTEVGRPWMRLFHEDDALLFQRPAAIFDPHTGARFKPRWRGRFHYAGGREFVSVEVNQLGFRFPAYRDQPAEGVVRVALLGDSLTAGLQVEESSHVRALVEGALNAERPAEVLNFGIPGTGPVNQLGVYRSFAARFRPDVVVLGIYTDNDFTDNEHTVWRRADGTLVDEPFVSAPGDLGKTLKANFCLAMALSAWREAAAHRRDAEADAAAAADTDVAALERRESHELAHVSAEAFEKALAVWDELVAEARRASAVPIVLLFPDKSVFTDGRWDYARPTTRLLHERLARHFEAKGVQVIGGADMLRRHSERYGARPWGKYKNYLSEEGHKTLAELLVARIHGVLPPGAPPAR